MEFSTVLDICFIFVSKILLQPTLPLYNYDIIIIVCAFCMFILTEKRRVMQAFLKGATVQAARPQKDKAVAGPSAEKKAKAVPWVEK